jgi:hypothetical protein
MLPLLLQKQKEARLSEGKSKSVTDITGHVITKIFIKLRIFLRGHTSYTVSVLE